MNCIPHFGVKNANKMVLIPLGHNGLDQVNVRPVEMRRISHFYIQNMHFMEPILSNSLKNDRTMRHYAEEIWIV